MYENNIHVPLVIYHSAYKGGNRYNSITSHLDNDVEMFRMSLLEIPDEMENLAAGKAENTSLINEYNQKLNTLISREIGTDNGSETDAYYPGGILNFVKQR